MARTICGCIVAMVAACVGVAGTATAAADDGETAIRWSLAQRTTDFNMRNGDRLCDLFAPDLKYDYRGFPERGYDAICGLLRKSVGDPGRRFHYDIDIKEIRVSGDLAMTRLVWTLSASRADGSDPVRSNEVGMDIFRRQADGSWKIWRYIAYEAP